MKAESPELHWKNIQYNLMPISKSHFICRTPWPLQYDVLPFTKYHMPKYFFPVNFHYVLQVEPRRKGHKAQEGLRPFVIRSVSLPSGA